MNRARQRATALVIRGGRVLLVRDRGKHHYSLPGGRIEPGESARNAAARELKEELGMHASKVRRLPSADYQGSRNDHHVSLITTRDTPRIQGHELDAFLWWDMRRSLPMYAHVKEIIGRLSSGATRGYNKDGEGGNMRRKFGNLSYDFDQTFSSKEAALKEANDLRAKGHLAHVVYISEDKYDLYSRKGKDGYRARNVERQILKQAGYKNHSNKEGSMKYIDSYAQAEALGIKPCDSIIGTVVDDTKTPPLIMAMPQGHTFSGRDIDDHRFSRAPMHEYRAGGMTFYAADAKALFPLLKAKLRNPPRSVTMVRHTSNKVKVPQTEGYQDTEGRSKLHITSKPVKEKAVAKTKGYKPRANKAIQASPTLITPGGKRVKIHRGSVIKRR